MAEAVPSSSQLARLHRAAIRRFRSFYPDGFDDPDYIALERSYKVRAHDAWRGRLSRPQFENALIDERYNEIASAAVAIEARTNLLYSFEKIALRDAVRTRAGARTFADGLFDFLYGAGTLPERFGRWVEAVASLPQAGRRVLTWPVVTVFPFIAEPKRHLFLKPRVTQTAATRWGFPFHYVSRPAYPTYRSLLELGKDVRAHVGGRDQIDVQGFLWVLGSDEYD